MYSNLNNISVIELEEELKKCNMKIVLGDGKILAVEQEDSDVQTT